MMQMKMKMMKMTGDADEYGEYDDEDENMLFY